MLKHHSQIHKFLISYKLSQLEDWKFWTTLYLTNMEDNRSALFSTSWERTTNRITLNKATAFREKVGKP